MTTSTEHIIQSKVPGKFDSYLPNYTEELTKHYQEVSSRLNSKTPIPISCSDSPVSIKIKHLRKRKPPRPDIVALPNVIVPTTTDVIDTVIHHYNVSYYDLTGPNRKSAWIRQIAMWLCCRLTGESVAEIGRPFNRDHTTIMHGRDLVQSKYERDPKLANDLIDVIMECLQEARASLGC